jgi:hypothetical protein
MAWIVAIVSLSLYLKGQINYIISLWVSDEVEVSPPEAHFDESYR